METREEMVPVMIDMTCDKCGAGKMHSDGMVLTSSPPQYPHVCTDCGDSKIFWVCYPRIVHEARK